MAAFSDTQLESMGLEPENTATHQVLSHSDWPTRTQMHTAIKAQTQADKPKVVDMWRTAKGNTVTTSVYCNMGIHIIKISCVVTGGGVGGADKPLPDEYYLCKEEMGAWTIKYLTASEGPHKQNAHLKQA